MSKIINLSDNPYETNVHVLINKEKTDITVVGTSLIYAICINGMCLLNTSEINPKSTQFGLVDLFNPNKFNDLEHEIELHTVLNRDVVVIVSGYVYAEVDVVYHAYGHNYVNQYIYFLFHTIYKTITIYNYRRRNIIVQYKKACIKLDRSEFEKIIATSSWFQYNGRYAINRYGEIYPIAKGCKFPKLIFN